MTTDLFDLTGKTALVSGASRGIGKAIAELLAAQGAHVIVSSRRIDGAQAVVDELVANGRSAEAMACHVGRLDDIAQLFAAIRSKHGRLDILVNNAATNPHFGPILAAEEGHWAKILDVNVVGYFRMAKAAAVAMQKRGGGCIINIASIAGKRPQPGMGVYCVSKAAVLMLTEVLAAELAVSNIRVNAIAPGFIKTAFSSAIWNNPQMYEAVMRIVPQQRMAEPDELTGIALYLASDASSFTTGGTFLIDGGQYVDAGMGS
jgi:NAD(P)-dependent dehydrogenase (short-subunit alcohol dehydrogenase family)